MRRLEHIHSHAVDAPGYRSPRAFDPGLLRLTVEVLPATFPLQVDRLSMARKGEAGFLGGSGSASGSANLTSLHHYITTVGKRETET